MLPHTHTDTLTLAYALTQTYKHTLKIEREKSFVFLIVIMTMKMMMTTKKSEWHVFHSPVLLSCYPPPSFNRWVKHYFSVFPCKRAPSKETMTIPTHLDFSFGNACGV